MLPTLALLALLALPSPARADDEDDHERARAAVLRGEALPLDELLARLPLREGERLIEGRHDEIVELRLVEGPLGAAGGGGGVEHDEAHGRAGVERVERSSARDRVVRHAVAVAVLQAADIRDALRAGLHQFLDAFQARLTAIDGALRDHLFNPYPEADNAGTLATSAPQE